MYHGWFHLHVLTRPVLSVNRELQDEKSLAHSGIRTRDLSHTKRTR